MGIVMLINWNKLRTPEKRYVEAGLEDSRQESKKQGLKTLVDKLRWKIKYEDLAQGEGFRSRVVLTKPEGDTVELEWSEAKQASVL